MTTAIMPATFTRSVCACASCVACCTSQPGPLAVGDLDRIAAYLGKPIVEILRSFWASPGAVVKNVATGRTWMIGTITPRMLRDRCVFLTADDRCAIHPVAPFGCAYVDTHMAARDWQPRAQWLYRSIEADVEYQSIRRALAPATSWRPRTG